MIQSFGLNDDEVKRIMFVIEKDFQLRQKESRRIEQLRKVIRQEHERVEYLAGSKEFNSERCISCLKTFRRFFNPKEFCSVCQLFVCRDCAIYHKQRRLWLCKLCFQLRELESLTADWFYNESSKKFKRCGAAKVVDELHKQRRASIDEDPGYGTLGMRLSAETKDSDSIPSYVIHDKTLQTELNEYSQRLKFLLDNLESSLSEHDKRKINLKNHQQQITSEISRARTALSGPIRSSDSNKRLHTYENDLQNLLIKKTEEILDIDLQEFQKYTSIKTNFDHKLAQIIIEKYVKQANRKTTERQSSIVLKLSGNQKKKKEEEDVKTTTANNDDVVITWF